MTLETLEGNTFKLDGGAMFGNAPKELWQRWMPPDELNRIPLASRCFLLRTNQGANILFETGIGAFFDPKLKERYGIDEKEHRLLKSLEKVGLTDADIDYVILSHLHFDHAGGLLAPYEEGVRLLFPKARYVLGKRHFEYAAGPHMREKASFIPHLSSLLEASGRLVLVEGDRTDQLPSEVADKISFKYVDGHTIGLMLSEIDIDGELSVFVSDLIPGIPWIHLPLTMGYDRYSELLVNEKAALYPEWHRRGANLLFTHDPNVASAKLTIDEKGKFSPQR